MSVDVVVVVLSPTFMLFPSPLAETFTSFPPTVDVLESSHPNMKGSPANRMTRIILIISPPIELEELIL